MSKLFVKQSFFLRKMGGRRVAEEYSSMHKFRHFVKEEVRRFHSPKLIETSGESELECNEYIMHSALQRFRREYPDVEFESMNPVPFINFVITEDEFEMMPVAMQETIGYGYINDLKHEIQDV